MVSLKGDLDKKTKGAPENFERSLDENTAILENLVTKLRIWGVLETKISNRSMKTKVQHCKQQQRSKRNVCSTDQKTQQKSSPVGLHLKHLRFIISHFFVDEECA